MRFEITSLPLFAGKGVKLADEKANEPFGSLTVQQAEKLLKTWFYETLLELQQPDEYQPPFYNRLQVAEKLGISLPTVDSWVLKGILPCHYLGKRRVFLPGDLDDIVEDHNFYNPKTKQL